MMHGREKPDSSIGAGKPANKAEGAAAEPVERREEAEGNMVEQSMPRTQSRAGMSQENRGQSRISPAASAPVAFSGKSHPDPNLPWPRITRLATLWLPKARVLHPWPSTRFPVRHPRQEPYAGIPLVQICVGGAG